MTKQALTNEQQEQADAAHKKLHSLNRESNKNDLKRGVELRTLSNNGLFSHIKNKETGKPFATFKAYCDADSAIGGSGITYRTAQRMVQVVEQFVDELECDQSTLAGIGITKLSMIAPYADEDNIDDILKAAKGGKKNLQAKIKQGTWGDPVGSPSGNSSPSKDKSDSDPKAIAEAVESATKGKVQGDKFVTDVVEFIRSLDEYRAQNPDLFDRDGGVIVKTRLAKVVKQLV